MWLQAIYWAKTRLMAPQLGKRGGQEPVGDGQSRSETQGALVGDGGQMHW